jgi:hypothetical protein
VLRPRGWSIQKITMPPSTGVTGDRPASYAHVQSPAGRFRVSGCFLIVEAAGAWVFGGLRSQLMIRPFGGNGLVRPPLALEPSQLSPPHHGRANPGSVRQHMGQAGTAIGRPDGQVKEISGMNWPVSGDMGCSPRVRTHPCAHPLNISTAAHLSASFPVLRPENVV